MRLSSLKLAGFKSFVDSTTLVFPDNRTAVVGPNGCGKSNVIDAIRWVMGESSARQLRGGAMADVIFAGTAQRKPVGQASVELRFENTQGKLGGEYNAYTELSVRRQVNRDGRSDYFLNGTRCRRRDITDIFLGTGLGPRSYAIIEQGMINRLIDAKPDDMRVFIEEAAGVSRYQARRRETLQHLERTRQNLSRLHDIGEELQAQMRSLKRQSQAAIKYHELEQQQLELNINIWSAHYAQAQTTQQQYTKSLTLLSQQYTELRGQRNQAETDWQTGNQVLTELLAKAEPMQQHWQHAEREVNQHESWLQQYQQDTLQRSNQIEQWQHNQQVIKSQLLQDRQHIVALDQDIIANQQAINEATHQLKQLEQQLTQAVHVHKDAEQNWQHTKQQHQKQQQQQQSLQQQLDANQRAQLRLEQQIQHTIEQLERLQNQQQHVELDDLDVAQQDLLLDKSNLQQQHTSLQQQIDTTQQALLTLNKTLQQKKQQQQQDQSEFDALQQLQAQIINLVKQSNSTTSNVSKTDQPPVLLQQLKLSEDAKPHIQLIEKLLGDWLTSTAQQEFNGHEANSRSYLTVSVSQTGSINQTGSVNQAACNQLAVLNILQHDSVIPLSHWVEPMLSCWQAVGVVSSHKLALSLQSQLNPQQSLLSLDGFWLGSNWQVNLNLDDSAARQQGVLQQQLRMQVLEQQLNHLSDEIVPLTVQQQQLNTGLTAYQTDLTNIENTKEKLIKQQQLLALQHAKLTSTLQANQQQSEQLKQQQIDLQLTWQDDQAQIAEWHMTLASINLALKQLEPQLDSQQQHLLICQQQRQTVQIQHQAVQQQLQQLQIVQQNISVQHEATQQSIMRAQPQQQQIEQQLSQLEQAAAQALADYPTQLARLQQSQQLAQQAHTAWANWQQQLAFRQQEQQRLNDLRQQGQSNEDQLRDALEKSRLDWQDCKNKMEQALAHLVELNAEPISVDSNDIERWQQQLEKTQQQIQKLGQLNLAAPEALRDVSQRYDELAHQIQDLQQTIDQLEQAMKSIDQETRSLFMQTFEQINTELGVLFPKVFGGGEASLSLDSDWQSGVRLMARPPGKRNSSLALLSGGEKALTALALVFAIFRLNPAPFCVLDEVDAPLDDANVQRFCHLVKELSQQVQFIYITHNKLAMTMATDLLGVTMPEAGASRLVAVNIEQAAKFSATSE